MICLRCGYCCHKMFVPILINGNKPPEESNIIVHKGLDKPCPHLRGKGPGKYKCLIHNKRYYDGTPCFNHTQIEQKNSNCRMGDYILKNDKHPNWAKEIKHGKRLRSRTKKNSSAA